MGMRCCYVEHEMESLYEFCGMVGYIYWYEIGMYDDFMLVGDT